MLAVRRRMDAGYDEAILLTSDGFIADGSGENVFRRQVTRHRLHAGSLDLDPARDHARHRHPDRDEALGYVVVEKQPDPLRPLPRGRGVFMCGTCLAEVPRCGRVDRRRARRRPGDGGEFATSTCAAGAARASRRLLRGHGSSTSATRARRPDGSVRRTASAAARGTPSQRVRPGQRIAATRARMNRPTISDLPRGERHGREDASRRSYS
jgi:hypothetical protein